MRQTESERLESPFYSSISIFLKLIQRGITTIKQLFFLFLMALPVRRGEASKEL